MNLKTKLIIVFSIMILCLVYKYRDKIKPLLLSKESYQDSIPAPTPSWNTGNKIL